MYTELIDFNNFEKENMADFYIYCQKMLSIQRKQWKITRPINVHFNCENCISMTANGRFLLNQRQIDKIMNVSSKRPRTNIPMKYK